MKLSLNFKNFKGLGTRWREKDYRPGIDPNRDWITIVAATVIFCVLMVSFSLYIFGVVNSGVGIGAIQDSASQETKIFNFKLLNQVLDHNEGDKAELQKLITGPPHVIDPSI